MTLVIPRFFNLLIGKCFQELLQTKIKEPKTLTYLSLMTTMPQSQMTRCQMKKQYINIYAL